MDGGTDRQTDGRTPERYTKPTVHTAACDEWMVGQTDRQTDGRTPERYTEPTVHTAACDGRIMGQTDGQTDGRTDGHLSVTPNILCIQRRMTGE